MVIPFDRRTGSTHAGRRAPGRDQPVVPASAPRNHGDGLHDAHRRWLLAFRRPMGANTLNADDAADLVRMDDDGGHQSISG